MTRLVSPTMAKAGLFVGTKEWKDRYKIQPCLKEHADEIRFLAGEVGAVMLSERKS